MDTLLGQNRMKEKAAEALALLISVHTRSHTNGAFMHYSYKHATA